MPDVPLTDQQYGALLTLAGQHMEANAKVTHTVIDITHIAVGDGNGLYVTPNEAQTTLVNEVGRYAINLIEVRGEVDASPVLHVEALVPPEDGGFTLRELAAIAADGTLIAVANCPPNYKPLPSQNAPKRLPVRINFAITSDAAWDLVINDDLVMASREWSEMNFAINVESIAAFHQKTGFPAQEVYLKSYWSGLNKGGGTFRWDPSGIRTEQHDGILWVSPTVPPPHRQTVPPETLQEDISNVQFQQFLGGVGETAPAATGGWKRSLLGSLSPYECGLYGDDRASDSHALQAFFGANVSTITIVDDLTLKGQYSARDKKIHIERGVEVECALGNQVNGFVLTLTNCELYGGLFFSNEEFESGSNVTGNIKALGGSITDTWVYSQLGMGIKADDCELRGDCRVFGGVYKSYYITLNVDRPYNANVYYHNSGVAYCNKQAVGQFGSDNRAVHIEPFTDISFPVRLDVIGEYSWKNALWVGDSTHAINDLVANTNIKFPGFWIDSNGEKQDGDGSGTCVEVVNCPDAIVDGETFEPRGYNVAVASGSHRCFVKGTHKGNSGDPGVAVFDSDNCVIEATIDSPTIGVAIGGITASSTGTEVRKSTFKNCSHAPVSISEGYDTSITDSVFINAPSSPAYIGAFSGLGKSRPVVELEAGHGNRDVSLIGNTYIGNFNQEVRDSEMRYPLVRSEGNHFLCCIIPTEDTYGGFGQKKEGATHFIRVLNDTDSNGHAYVGEILVPASDTERHRTLAINPELKDISTRFGSIVDDPDRLKKYHIVFFVQYQGQQNDPEKKVRFGLSSSGGAAYAHLYLYEVWDAIKAFYPSPQAGDWFPITCSLDELIHPDADKTNLQYFNINLGATSPGYDFVITKPVIVHTGRINTL